MNDPNGLVYYRGEYHLFFQHNPVSVKWGNMTWGHAVSPDLLHWTQLDHALHPDDLGTIFSGSAIVDWHNTGGFKSGEEEVLVAIYTSAGTHASAPVAFTQSIAYSNDRGRSWIKHGSNPVIDHVRRSSGTSLHRNGYSLSIWTETTTPSIPLQTLSIGRISRI